MYARPRACPSVLLFGLMTVVGGLPVAAATNAPSGGASTSLNVVVTARRWSEPLQSVPGAVTVRTSADLAAAGATDLRDAARGVPDLTLGEFTVRRLTFPYVRGIGSGPDTPAVATYVDGVPQFSYATANQDLLDAERVEFLRGPQSALYGRNTLGGVINIVPRPPSRDPGGVLTVFGGDHGAFGARGSVWGPLGPGDLAGSLSVGFDQRDGFTENDLTGHLLDDRQSLAARAQLQWAGQDPWRFRLSVGAERDRDGDYALYDLAALRARPHHVAHDFEGFSDRDLVQPAFTAERRGDAVDFVSVTAFQWWRAHDRTDLDATALDLLRKDTREEQRVWTEELRLSSAADAPVRLGDRVALRWMVGALGFDAAHDKESIRDNRPLFVQMLGQQLYGDPHAIPPYLQHDDATLDDLGLSLYGQTTLVLDDRLELGLGLRQDWEHRKADLRSYATPAVAPATASSPERDFSQTSPQVSLGWHVTPDVLAYVKAAKGYKSGGFNAQAPAGRTAYDEETSWTYEAGLKNAWFENRVVANLALFETRWDNLQMNMPMGAGGLYFVDNAGKARSRGAELELTVRPCEGLDLFGSAAWLDTQLRPGSQATDGMSATPVDVGGNDLPFAPHMTWNIGAQYSHALAGRLRGFVRVEGVGASRYFYDALNRASQGAVAMANLRVGMTAGDWRVEGWVKNLFDRDTVPLALPYPGLAPSGYVGESGAPRTIGVSLTRTF